MRFPRFRLRTLMIVVAIVAVIAASVTWRLREIERQRRVVELLLQSHAPYEDVLAQLHEMERQRQIAELLRHYHGPDVDFLALERFRAGTRVPVPPPAPVPEATREAKPE